MRIPPALVPDVIVVANACSDTTIERVGAVGALFPFPLRHVEETRPGLNIARNRCLAEARGEIVAFLDDDVRVEPDWLLGLIEGFQEARADLLAGKITLWWDNV